MTVNLTRLFDGNANDFKRWLKRIVVGGGGVVGAQALSAWACTKWNDNRVFHRISGGYCSDGKLVSHGAAACHFQRRPELMRRVARLLQPGPDLPSDAYYCILGAPNSGKTHIVRQACEEVGGGVIYLQITVPDMFGSELAAAIDYQGGALNVVQAVQNNVVKAIFGGGASSDGKDQIDTAIDALVKGSRAYQARHRRPVVLVLDDVDRLAEKQPGLVEELQSCAKAWSNSGLLRLVFVLSDGPALSQMKRRSAWSRANVSSFVTVDDVSEQEALTYLTGRGVAEKDASEIYSIAGGRIGLLSHLATSIADMGIECEEALHSVVEAAADEFKVAGLLDEGPRRKGGLAAINKLLEAGGGDDEWSGISVLDWSRAVPQPANQKALLASRVFVRHYPHQEIMFGSRPTAIYARHLARTGGHRRHHTWRDHHPRPGGSGQRGQQPADTATPRQAACCSDAAEADSKGGRDNSSGRDENRKSRAGKEGCSSDGNAGCGNSGGRASGGDDSCSASKGSDCAGAGARLAADNGSSGVTSNPDIDTSWKVVMSTIEQDGSSDGSSDGDTGGIWREATKRHRENVRER